MIKALLEFLRHGGTKGGKFLWWFSWSKCFYAGLFLSRPPEFSSILPDKDLGEAPVFNVHGRHAADALQLEEGGGRRWLGIMLCACTCESYGVTDGIFGG
jgi:hypothetical protein